jgi:hypothetical protein
MWSPLFRWREDGSVVYRCCWASPAQSFSGTSPMGFQTRFYCLRFETFLFVAFYDSQGYGGGIRPRLHTVLTLFWSERPLIQRIRIQGNVCWSLVSRETCSVTSWFPIIHLCGFPSNGSTWHNILDFYSGSIRFEFLPGYRMSCLRFSRSYQVSAD